MWGGGGGDGGGWVRSDEIPAHASSYFIKYKTEREDLIDNHTFSTLINCNN